MTKYIRIVCTEQVPYGNSPCRARIVAVGYSYGGDYWEGRLTLEQVLGLMRQGYTFYTKGTTSGKIALVDKYLCGTCNRYHIRSNADCVTDNNLDSLGYCAWNSRAA